MQDQSAVREAYNQASKAYARKFIDELEGNPAIVRYCSSSSKVSGKALFST